MSSLTNKNDNIEEIVTAFEQSFDELHQLINRCKDSGLSERTAMLTTEYNQLMNNISTPWDPSPTPNQQVPTEWASNPQGVGNMDVTKNINASWDNRLDPATTAVLNPSSKHHGAVVLHVDLGEMKVTNSRLAEDILREPVDSKFSHILNSVKEEEISRVIIQNSPPETLIDLNTEIKSNDELDAKIANLRNKLKGNIIILCASLLVFLIGIGFIAYGSSTSVQLLRLVSLASILSFVILSISLTSIILISLVQGRLLSEQIREVRKEVEDVKKRAYLSSDNVVVLQPA